MEKTIAISQNRYHQGVPAIMVIVDGSWSKRYYKHSYNAKSGVGIIIYRQSNWQELYMGVRNKYCAVCYGCIIRHMTAIHHNILVFSTGMDLLQWRQIMNGFGKTRHLRTKLNI